MRVSSQPFGLANASWQIHHATLGVGATTVLWQRLVHAKQCFSDGIPAFERLGDYLIDFTVDFAALTAGKASDVFWPPCWT